MDTQKFSSPQEEIAFLRAQIAFKEKNMKKDESPVTTSSVRASASTPSSEPAPQFSQPSRVQEKIPASYVERVQEVVKEAIGEHRELPSEQFEKGYRMLHTETQHVAVEVKEKSVQSAESPIAPLIDVLETKGVRNAINVAIQTGDPYLEDEFHRYLVDRLTKDQLLASKLAWSEKDELGTALFEIVLPPDTAQDRETQLRSVLSVMEQFLSGMLSVADDGKGNGHFALEIANPRGTALAIFYVAVPRGRAGMFEKHVLGTYPKARVSEIPNDYNIFNPHGCVTAGYATSKQSWVYPIKTLDQFESDPLLVILNTFSKLDAENQGASIQFIVKPVGNEYESHAKHAIKQIESGADIAYATDIRDTTMGSLTRGLKDLIAPPKHMKVKSESAGAEGESKKIVGDAQTQKTQNALEQINKKLSSHIVLTNIRVIASAGNQQDADRIYQELTSSFNQFSSPLGNGIAYSQVKKSALAALEKAYIFRDFDFDQRIPLSLQEIASAYHFSAGSFSHTPHLKTSHAQSAPAPSTVSSTGVLLGVNNYRGVRTEIRMDNEDRVRHMYVIGQTGTGKSTLIKNMAIQDIQNGHGVCFIDPHGVDVQDILASVPPERHADVIYFDPSYAPRPMALNMLEYDRNSPEQKTFVVNEMLSIFNKLFDMKTAGGPMFEQYFRNATMLVIEDPETGSTLLDVSRVLSDKNFRLLKLSRCKNPVVTQFWREVAEKAGGESSLANMVPYITSKFDVFLSNDIMRPLIAREQSTFNFREMMDGRKILLVNLAKGKLGDINANLIGLILVGKILMAALSRVDMVGKSMADFYLYIDEFQNVTTDSISSILSEARKYRLSLNVAHQYIKQLDEKIRDAVFGNVGSMAVFRVGSDDAEYLAKQFAPVFTPADLMSIDNRNAYVRMLVHGQPVQPFNIETVAPPTLHPEILETLKQQSYEKYGIPREEIEAEIKKKYAKKSVESTSAPASTLE